MTTALMLWAGFGGLAAGVVSVIMYRAGEQVGYKRGLDDGYKGGRRK